MKQYIFYKNCISDQTELNEIIKEYSKIAKEKYIDSHLNGIESEVDIIIQSFSLSNYELSLVLNCSTKINI